MRSKKTIVYILTVVFLAIALFVGYIEVEWKSFPFSVVLSTDDGREQIQCWKKVPDTFYVFLPGYADLSQARLKTNRFHEVYVNGELLQNGMTCEDFSLNVPLDMAYTNGGEVYHQTLIFTQSANVATMYIDVSSGSMDYIHEKKGNEETGVMRLYTADGALQYRGELESIRGRGNATWEDEKKPYSLQLSQEADLLGLGTASKWILLSNSGDSSHLRNRISFDLAEAVNLPYTPQCTWTDVYLNGEYAGLYVLCESNEVHPQRVDIDPNSSFLVSIEPEWRLQMQGYTYIVSDSEVALRIHQSAMQADTVRQIWQSAENAILAEDGIDPVTGKRWDELIDVDSWVRKYLIEEIFANEDSCVASEFFFYEAADGKIYAGPIWDMDVILSAGSLQCMSPSAILAGRPHLWSETDSPLFYALLQKREFHDKMVVLYRQEFYPLLTQLIDSGLEQYAQQTAQAAAVNQMRWPAGDAGDAVDAMRTFLVERMRFLDDYWIHQESYYLVQVQYGGIWAFAVRPGEILDYLPDFEGEQWYMADTNQLFDKTVPVTQDIRIYTKQISWK